MSEIKPGSVFLKGNYKKFDEVEIGEVKYEVEEDDNGLFITNIQPKMKLYIRPLN